MENIGKNVKKTILFSSGKPFEALIQLLGVARELEHDLTSKLSYFELSTGKLKILTSLLNHERPLNPSELADHAGVTRSTITGLVRRVANMNVLQIAKRKVIKVSWDEEIENIAAILGKKQIKKLPVERNGVLVGIISRGDVIRHSFKH